MTPSAGEVRAALHEAIGDVAPEVDLREIRADRPFREQAELDSFDFLRVLALLEQRLGVRVPEADYHRFATLDGAVACLVERLARPGSPPSP